MVLGSGGAQVTPVSVAAEEAARVDGNLPAAARLLARRFVAGASLELALEVSRKLQGEGIPATLDHLGESVTSLAEAAEARDV